jgi:hypothetical protein
MPNRRTDNLGALLREVPTLLSFSAEKTRSAMALSAPPDSPPIIGTRIITWRSAGSPYA